MKIAEDIKSNLTTEEISAIIRTETGINEDAFQDAWVTVLEKRLVTEEDVRQVAKQSRKVHSAKAISRSYKERSLNAPLNEDGFTLEDIIPSQTIQEEPGEQTSFRKWGRNLKGTFRLDSETTTLLKAKYPNLTYLQAIRFTLGLPIIYPLIKKWQPWEDEILRRLYPTGGTFSVSKEVSRSAHGIRIRAKRLGVRFISFHPIDTLLKHRDVCLILHINEDQLGIITKKGLLNYVRPFRNYVLFSRSDVIAFIKNSPFEYRHTHLSDEYKEYVPKWVWQWQPPSKIAQELHICVDSVRTQVRQGKCQSKTYRPFIWYVRKEDVQEAIEKRKLRRQPYKVSFSSDIKRNPTHYIAQDKDGNWIHVCHPNGKYHLAKAIMLEMNIKPRFTRGYPSCKRCLGILRTSRRGGNGG